MKRTIWGATFLLLLLSGCRASEPGVLFVQGVWARPSPEGAQTAAFYMTLVNESEDHDVLQTVSIDACETVELHRSSMDEDGVMRMAPVPGGQIVVPPDKSVVLQPGGLHVMCIGLTQPLLEGQDVPLTLDFEVAGPIAVLAQIRQEAP